LIGFLGHGSQFGDTSRSSSSISTTLMRSRDSGSSREDGGQRGVGVGSAQEHVDGLVGRVGGDQRVRPHAAILSSGLSATIGTASMQSRPSKKRFPSGLRRSEASSHR
jgi:hypothetical protein